MTTEESRSLLTLAHAGGAMAEAQAPDLQRGDELDYTAKQRMGARWTTAASDYASRRREI